MLINVDVHNTFGTHQKFTYGTVKKFGVCTIFNVFERCLLSTKVAFIWSKIHYNLTPLIIW